MTTYVNSINNMTGVVTLTKADIGLGNVDNISLAGIIQSISSVTSVNGFTGTVVLDKSHIGLGNVANASINEIKANITTADIEALGFVPGSVGSVSNADTVDGYHAASFALLAGATFLGALATNATTFRVGDTAGTYRVFRNDGYISSDGTNFYKIWTSANDGAGSGLDADTLDGLHAADIAVTGSSTDPLFGRVRIDDDGFNLDVVSGEPRLTFNAGGGGAANTFFGYNRSTKNLRWVVDGAQVFSLASNAYLTLNKITVNEPNSFFYRDITIYQANGDGFIYWNSAKTKRLESNPGGFSFSHTVYAPQLVSNATYGTQPIQVTSTTMVSNLNAQYLGGYQEAAFAKLTGATFSGNVYANDFSGNGASFVNGVGVGSGGVDSYITYYQPGVRNKRLLVATNTATNQGGWIGLYGDQHASFPGYFRLGAGYQSGASTSVLEGRGDGTLTWKYATQANPYTVWHSGNDGATSGLDADTVDGVHAEKFARANIDESNPNFTGAGTAMRLWNVAGIGADNMNSFWVGLNNSAADGVLALYSNYYDLSAFGANMKMYAWNWQTVGDRGVFEIQASNSTDYITLRGTPAGVLTWGANAIYHAGNDGAGSGLDADLLDGLHASAFVQIVSSSVLLNSYNVYDNKNDVYTLTITHGTSSVPRSSLQLGNNSAQLKARSATQDYSYVYLGGGSISLNCFDGSTTKTLLAQAAGTLTWDGSSVYHAGNLSTKAQFNAALSDGDFLYVGDSISNADTVDGYHASSFLLSGQSIVLPQGLPIEIKSTTSGTTYTVLNVGAFSPDFGSAPGAYSYSRYDSLGNYQIQIRTTNGVGYGLNLGYSYTSGFTVSNGSKTYSLAEAATANTFAMRDASGNLAINALTVQSTGLVTNLNADLLDGNHASAFALLTGATFTGDITTYRSASPTTGVIYFGSGGAGARYLYYDGSNYSLGGANLYINGSLALTSANYSSYALPLSGGTLTGDLTFNTGGAYGRINGYPNNNHFMSIRGAVSGSTGSPSISGAHQTTFVEYAEANDSTGWYFKSSASGTYTEFARITDSGLSAKALRLANGFSISQGPSSNYASLNSWVYLPGVHGFYSAVNDAHFYPNNADYGSWRIAGTRNGWYGLYFDSGSTLMMNSGHVGFHRTGVGWQFYWAAGTAYVYKGDPGGGTQAAVLDSVNYSSYVTGSYLNGIVANAWSATSQIVSGNNGMAAYDGSSNMNTLNLKSGFYMYNNPANGYYGNWTTWIQASGHYVGDNYGFQIASGYWDDSLWFRKVTNNSWGGWFKLIRMDSSNRVWMSGTNTELMIHHTGGTANQRIGRIQMLDGEIHMSIVNDAVSAFHSYGVKLNSAVFYPNADNNLYLGSVNNRWIAVYAVNGTIQTSDANKKQDIADTTLGLDFILDAKPKAYRWKSGTDNRLHHGLLAQDVAHLVQKYGDFGGLYGTDGLNYAEFIAPLIKAVQELAQEVRQLRKTH